jgi:predicted alpha/beta superfamily hydrolase
MSEHQTGWEARGPRLVDGTEVFLVDCTLGDRLEVTVAAPTFAPPGHVLATLYVLDPMATLDTVIGVSRGLAMLAPGAFPPVIVVGVGYDADPMTVMSLRMRDQTPSEASPPPALAPPIPAGHGTGGGDRFLDAVLDEIAPVVEQRYPADPDRRMLVGWSLGGLLVAHALVDRPGAFAGHLIASPALWWDDARLLRDLDAGDRRSLAGRAYVAVGEREESSTTRTWPAGPTAEGVELGRMVTNATRLADRVAGLLASPSDLRFEVLADEHHVTIFPTALSRGLIHLLAPDALRPGLSGGLGQ